MLSLRQLFLECPHTFVEQSVTHPYMEDMKSLKTYRRQSEQHPQTFFIELDKHRTEATVFSHLQYISTDAHIKIYAEIKYTITSLKSVYKQSSSGCLVLMCKTKEGHCDHFT